MENLWILAAAAENQGQSVISAEPVGKEGQAVTTVDSNATGKTPPPKPLAQQFSWIFIVVIFIVMFMMFREPKR